MRQEVNDLSLELIFEELLKLKGQDKTDKERDFLIKAHQVSSEGQVNDLTDELDQLTSAALEDILLNGKTPVVEQTDSEGSVDPA